MKKTLYSLLIGGWLIFFVRMTVLAQPNTASPSAAGKEVRIIKEKIASKVAELTKQEKKVISGRVIEIKDDQITLLTDVTLDEKKRIKIDPELTKFYQLAKGKKREIKRSVISKDDYLIVPGLIFSNVIANTVYRASPYVVSSGRIVAVDKKNYTIDVLTIDKDKYTFDIEKTTRQRILDLKTLGIKKAGFAKLKEGDRLHFVYNPALIDKKNPQKNHYPLMRYLIIPQEYFTN